MFTSIIAAADLAKNLDKNWIIVDCRFSLFDLDKGRQDYGKSHIPGAYYAHLDEDLSGEIIPGQTSRHPLPKIEDLEFLFSSWGVATNMQVVVYDNKSGAIAARLWWMLKWSGHDAAAVLNGGWQAWEAGNFPTEELAPIRNPARPKSNFKADVQHDLLITAEEVEKHLQDTRFTLIDSRASKRYQGLEEPIDPIAGHIPGALNLPFMENVDKDGHFLSVEALKNRFDSLLEKKDDKAFYCGSGVTACHNIVAYYHTTGQMPKLYAGSWSEWITDENRPMVKAKQ